MPKPAAAKHCLCMKGACIYDFFLWIVALAIVPARAVDAVAQAVMEWAGARSRAMPLTCPRAGQRRLFPLQIWGARR